MADLNYNFYDDLLPRSINIFLTHILIEGNFYLCKFQILNMFMYSKLELLQLPIKYFTIPCKFVASFSKILRITYFFLQTHIFWTWTWFFGSTSVSFISATKSFVYNIHFWTVSVYFGSTPKSIWNAHLRKRELYTILYFETNAFAAPALCATHYFM
jgi:hypothetical protein